MIAIMIISLHFLALGIFILWQTDKIIDKLDDIQKTIISIYYDSINKKDEE